MINNEIWTHIMDWDFDPGSLKEEQQIKPLQQRTEQEQHSLCSFKEIHQPLTL